MPDWTCASDYEFEDANEPARWVWEFLRRNPEYIADWKSVPSRTAKQLESYSKELGLPPHAVRPLFRPAYTLGLKWRIRGDIQDPDNNTIPRFRFDAPEMPMPNQVLAYYDTPDEIGQAYQREGFAVLVFRLREDLERQLEAASEMLQQLQKEQGIVIKKKKLWPSNFATYLRLFDAKRDKEPTAEIVRHIAAYKKVAKKTKADFQYAAQKRIGRDYKKVKNFVADPWSILP